MRRTVKKRKNVVSIILSIIFKMFIYMFIILGLIKVSIFSYDFGYSILSDNAVAEAPGIDIEVHIDDNMDANTVFNLLSNKGVILDKNVAYVQYKFFGFKIVAGDYILNNSKSSKEILTIINAGSRGNKDNFYE